MSPTATWNATPPGRRDAHGTGPMAPGQVMAAIAYDTAGFPAHALAEAVRLREDMVPLLLAELERLVEDPQAFLDEPTSYMRHLCAAYLLAQFREPRAYSLLLRCARLPGETLEALFGDFLSGDLGAVLASVSHGRVEALMTLVENGSAYELARLAALDALLVLVAEDAMPRADLVAFLRRWRRSLGDDDEVMMAFLVAAADELHPAELMPEIRAAYAQNLVDPSIIDLEDVEATLAESPESVAAQLREDRGYIGDAVELIGEWACFQEDYDPDAQDPDDTEQAPFRREEPKVGRNDPCPCGSGKKYKKCCMDPA
jgi:hypothetical protein